MPQRKGPRTLAHLCVQNIAAHMKTHWMPPELHNAVNHRILLPKYLIGPFESLSDSSVQELIHALYAGGNFEVEHLLLLLHNRLRRARLELVRPTKKLILSTGFCRFIGNNCTSLTELSLAEQIELTPAKLCTLLANMKRLKHLDLSHTCADNSVVTLVANGCSALEHLALRSCRRVFDDAVLTLAERLGRAQLQHLDLDNTCMDESTVERLLLLCPRLRYLAAPGLLNVLVQLDKRRQRHQLQCLDHNNNNNNNNNSGDQKADEEAALLDKLALRTCLVDNAYVLRADMMCALARLCPTLSALHVLCVGAQSALSQLAAFGQLSELVLGNTDPMLAYQFGGHLANALRHTFGARLRSLHLIQLVDVNLALIARLCPRLVKLQLELVGYYEPFDDQQHQQQQQSPSRLLPTGEATAGIATLSYLSVSNATNSSVQAHTNVERFKRELAALVGGAAQLRHLRLDSLNVLDDDFLLQQCLVPARHTLETLELRRVDSVHGDTLVHQLTQLDALRELHLHHCKQIGRADLDKLRRCVKQNDYDCKVTWV